MLQISNKDARRLFLDRQELCCPPRRKLATADLLQLIRSIGFVQVDSISTVARAHHMILFARNQTYKPSQLQHLLENERSLFEHWTHDAAIIPTEFYPYWRHRFRREERALVKRWRKWGRSGFEDMLESVFESVRDNGQAMARDFAGEKRSGGGWWDWKPEKTALEFHWRTGGLAITRRVGFQKVYDLTERVIPENRRTANVSEAAFIDWACRAALERLGTATAGELAQFWDHVTPKEAAAWCDAACATDEVIEILVDSADGERSRTVLAFPDLPGQLADLPEPPKRIRALSPFDPLMRDRKRLKRLFDFNYRIEVFVPAANRQYGYYVFPLLEGDRFIGRIDMKHDKDRDALVVAGLWLEPGVKLGRNRSRALEAELERQRRFVGAAGVVFDCEAP